MTIRRIVFLLLAILALSPNASGRSHSSGSSGAGRSHSGDHFGSRSGGHSSHSHSYAPHDIHSFSRSNSAPRVERDSRGRIERSKAATDEFKRETGYPEGRPGYVIDHIIPLKRGGPDTPANMQWQTIEDAKIKDKTE